MVWKELILNSFYFRRVWRYEWWSWKNSFRTVSTLGQCGGLERTDFEQFLLWEVVVVLKELILNSFYFGTVWWSWKNWFWTVSTLGGCGGLERTDFEQFLLWKGVEVGVVVLKGLILNSFYFGTVWWSWKNWIWTVSTLGQCGGLERTDFEQFLLWEGVVVLKELILNSFWLGKGVVVIKELTSEDFLLWEGEVVLKELILNSFYFVTVWWSWKNWFWTVSTLGQYGGLERTDFEQFLLWDSMVVLKELIYNSFYFGRVWWSWKNWISTVSALEGCCGLERTNLGTVSTLGRCGSLERTDCEQFLLWKGVEVGVVVLKELILNSFYFGRVWWSWKNWFWTVSTLGQCGGLERIHFEQFLLWEGGVV